MNLEKSFYKAIEDWVEHCKNPRVQINSSNQPVRNCNAYKKIISMGKEALPLIRELYDKNSFNSFELLLVQSHGLGAVVKEIVGDDFQIPKNMRGRIFLMEDYVKNWLDENMHKYVSGE